MLDLYNIISSLKFFGGVLDSTDVGFLHCKSEMCQAPISRHKAVHGEGYDSIEELLEAAREEYDNLVQFEQAEELEMVA